MNQNELDSDQCNRYETQLSREIFGEDIFLEIESKARNGAKKYICGAREFASSIINIQMKRFKSAEDE